LIVLMILSGAITALAGCSLSPVLSITNRSSLELTNVILIGSGFTQRVDSITAGEECRLTVHPRGDSGVRLAFDAGGQHIDTGEQGYFEASGGYRVCVTVGPDLKVSVSSDLERH